MRISYPKSVTLESSPYFLGIRRETYKALQRYKFSTIEELRDFLPDLSCLCGVTEAHCVEIKEAMRERGFLETPRADFSQSSTPKNRKPTRRAAISSNKLQTVFPV